MSFDKLWDFVIHRPGQPVQNRTELEHVYNLARECESYLEIGTANGDSLYVLGHAIKGNKITYVDYEESFTAVSRNQVISELKKLGKEIKGIKGVSQNKEVVEKARDKYDLVLIDADHKYDSVMQDARNYAPMAKKYVVFHDIKIPACGRAIREFAASFGKPFYEFISPDCDDLYGYGVIKL